MEIWVYCNFIAGYWMATISCICHSNTPAVPGAIFLAISSKESGWKQSEKAINLIHDGPFVSI